MMNGTWHLWTWTIVVKSIPKMPRIFFRSGTHLAGTSSEHFLWAMNPQSSHFTPCAVNPHRKFPQNSQKLSPLKLLMTNRWGFSYTTGRGSFSWSWAELCMSKLLLLIAVDSTSIPSDIKSGWLSSLMFMELPFALQSLSIISWTLRDRRSSFEIARNFLRFRVM